MAIDVEGRRVEFFNQGFGVTGRHGDSLERFELVAAGGGGCGTAVGQQRSHFRRPLRVRRGDLSVVGTQRKGKSQLFDRFQVFSQGILPALFRGSIEGQGGVAIPVVPGLLRMVDQQVVQPPAL